ncbi:hypothetical protein ACWF95_41705 [Streptomyces vinaceus]
MGFRKGVSSLLRAGDGRLGTAVVRGRRDHLGADLADRLSKRFLGRSMLAAFTASGRSSRARSELTSINNPETWAMGSSGTPVLLPRAQYRAAEDFTISGTLM